MIRLHVLGSLELRSSDGQELRSVLAQPKRAALLAYLALAQPRGFHRRDSLLPLFWPDFSQNRARQALRQAVHFLRRALGDGVLSSRGDEELALNSELLWCDAVAFETEVEKDPRAALEHYRGELLPGFFIAGADDFERWLEETRASLHRRAAGAAAHLASREGAKQGDPSALHWARLAAALAPDDEHALRRFLEMLVRTGDRGGAVRTYREFAERLKRDLDVEPSAKTRSFVASLFGPEYASTGDPEPVVGVPAIPTMALSDAKPQLRIEKSKGGAAYVIGAATLVLALLTAAVLLRRVPPMFAPETDAVVVLPFEVRAGRGAHELDYLREGMVDLLSAKLEGASGLRGIDPRAILSVSRGDTAAAAAEPGRRVAERFGAAFYVAGDIVKLAGRLQLSAAIYSRRKGWEPLTQVHVEGDAPALPALVDQLAAQLLTAFGKGRDTTLLRLAGLTTRSLPALKAYLAGASDFRAGRQAEAVEAFQEAVSEDTTFALAYYDLSMASRWVSSDGRLTVQSAAAAARHGDRLPSMARELLDGYQAYLRGDDDSAEAVYRSITLGHPDDVEGWFMLGETLFHHNARRGRACTESRAEFARVLELDSSDVHAIVHLARVAAVEGKIAELETLTRRLLATHPEAEAALEMRALLAFAKGDTATERSVATDAQRATDTELQAVLLAILSFAQKLDGAAPVSMAYGAPARGALYLNTGHLFLAQVPAARGIWRQPGFEPSNVAARDRDWPLEARALFATVPGIAVPRSWLIALRDSIARLRPHALTRPGGAAGLGEFRYHVDLETDARVYLLGLLSARLQDTAAAQKSVTELDRLSASPGDSGIGAALARGLRAEVIRLEQGSRPALAALSSFPLDSRLPVNRHIFWAGSHERFLKAELLHELGRDEEALPLYESFPREAYDLVYLAPSQRRQAEIYERMGKREDAEFHFSRFVDLWKDADPALQGLVGDARQSVARLESSK